MIVHEILLIYRFDSVLRGSSSNGKYEYDATAVSVLICHQTGYNDAATEPLFDRVPSWLGEDQKDLAVSNRCCPDRVKCPTG